MKIITKIKNDILYIYLNGELDESTSDYTRKSIDKSILESKCNKVIFDFQYLSFMDSTGIGVILGRYKLMKNLNMAIGIANCSGQIDKVLKMSGIYSIIQKIS